MTPEEQRVAIAKACGWTRFVPETIQYTAQRKDGKWGEIPDYPHDLNAMHDAESVLFKQNDETACEYEKTLNVMTTGWSWFATAAQRAEAFLRCLNLWKD